MAAAARYCTPVRSRWVRMFILMCDGTLSVLFKNGVCCNYPGTGAGWYREAVAAASPGRFVRRRLYKKMAYRIIRTPCPPAGCGQQTTCCPNPIPDTVHATFGGALTGTYALTYDAGQTAWVGGGPVGGGTLRLLLGCTGPNCNAFHLDVLCNGSPAGSLSTGLCSCSPLSLGMNGFITSTCATGGVSATVTV